VFITFRNGRFGSFKGVGAGPSLSKVKGALTCAVVSCLLMPFLAAAAFAQEPAASSSDKKDQPEVRITYLNVCTPTDAEQKELRSALTGIPTTKFTPDFEISRGRSTLDRAPTANWVRLRREYSPTVPYVAAQYAITVDEKAIIETLVFRSREAKDILQVQLEETITGAQDVKSVLDNDTPVNRIKLERFGKSSLVLARCATADQSKYEALFRQASQVLANYRNAMGIKRLVPRELSMLGPITPPKKSVAPSIKK
jgi:hypothetical protein